MSEYKFSCPHCDQHLSGTPAWAGSSLNCPTCKRDFTVPPPPAGAVAVPTAAAVAAVNIRATPPPAAGAPPRPPGPPRSVASAPAPARAPMVPSPVPTRAPAAPAPGGSNGLAVASMICGIVSCLGLGCLTGLPAVICGHLALSRIKSGRATTGRGMAIAGLVLGYLALVITVAFMIFWGTAFSAALKQAQSQRPPARSVPIVPERSDPARGPRGDRGNRPPRATPAAPATAVQAQPSEPKVSTDPASATIPEGLISGTLGGQPFKFGKAEFSTFMNTFTFLEGTGMMADKSIKLFFFPQAGESVLGRTWTVSASSQGMKPHVHYASPGQRGIESENYALLLELGQPQAGKVKGKLYLELPASKGTKLAGTFEAVVVK